MKLNLWDSDDDWIVIYKYMENIVCFGLVYYKYMYVLLWLFIKGWINFVFMGVFVNIWKYDFSLYLD